ncbi:MAG TPA: nicotinate (nicotinamide) nucleotide adenylyltransferase [Candidatus Kapabacteria bacterium]|nr:nicotinate (nicotinamide) nucleotide adenylyltransferase [Candidatus Kapabacteria bacterium]HPO61635.1 nicotinate (nicotinamide) nucleotide adenylyltransferase [Candidatus Kapabacteria bacterium]
MKNIGIFGGTFNPPHKSHLRIANCFIEQMNLDLCYFVPTFVSPFKINTDQSEIIDKKHILNMLNLLIHQNPSLKISNYEIEKEGISYTIETVRHFKDIYPNSNLFLLIGLDNLVKFHKWKDYTEILKLANLTIAPRIFDSNNFLFSSQNKLPNSELYKYNDIEFYYLKTEAMNYSSSDIRKNIAEGKPVSEILTMEVEEYILENKLYLINN